MLKLKKEKTNKINKNLIIKGYNPQSIYGGDDTKKIKFSFVSSLKDGNLECHRGVRCREFLIGYLRSSISEYKTKFIFIDNLKLDDIKRLQKTDKDELRLLVRIEGIDTNIKLIQKITNSFLFSKKVLNYYENKLEFEKSNVEQVKILYSETCVTGWLFTGSKNWIKSTVLISLYCLLLRASYRAFIYNQTLKDKKFTKKVIKKMWENYSPLDIDIDADIIKDNINKIDKIIKNKNILFNKSIKDMLLLGSRRSDQKYYAESGVEALIEGYHVDKKLTKLYKSL